MKLNSNLLDACWVSGSALGSCSPGAPSRTGDRGMGREFQLSVAGARQRGAGGPRGIGTGKVQEGRQEEREDKFLPRATTPRDGLKCAQGCTSVRSHRGEA